MRFTSTLLNAIPHPLLVLCFLRVFYQSSACRSTASRISTKKLLMPKFKSFYIKRILHFRCTLYITCVCVQIVFPLSQSFPWNVDVGVGLVSHSYCTHKVSGGNLLQCNNIVPVIYNNCNEDSKQGHQEREASRLYQLF